MSMHTSVLRIYVCYQTYIAVMSMRISVFRIHVGYQTYTVGMGVQILVFSPRILLNTYHIYLLLGTLTHLCPVDSSTLTLWTFSERASCAESEEEIKIVAFLVNKLTDNLPNVYSLLNYVFHICPSWTHLCRMDSFTSTFLDRLISDRMFG